MNNISKPIYKGVFPVAPTPFTDTGEIEYEGIIKDITHRKRAEEVIKKRNLELSILNKVAVGLNLYPGG